MTNIDNYLQILTNIFILFYLELAYKLSKNKYIFKCYYFSFQIENITINITIMICNCNNTVSNE